MRDYTSPLKFRQMGAGCRDGQQGFTLIEMSIVLVIIGLIIGGIVKGQEVVAGARMKSQVAQVDAIKGAVFTFQDKYQFLPGDYKAHVALTTNSAIDGNEDGFISTTGTASPQPVADTQDVSDASSYEANGAWIHLAAANLLAGIQLQGTTPTMSSATAAWYGGRVGNSFLWLSSFSSYGSVAPMVRLQGGTGAPSAILREQDAYALDLKFDDGVPATGAIVANSVTSNGCTQNASSTNAGTYALNGSNAQNLSCAINFLID